MKKAIVCVSALFIIMFYSPGPAITAEFMKKITIDHTKVSHEDLHNFPILIYITDPSLKSVYENGHISRNGGTDIHFTLPDGKTELPYNIISYNAYSGNLKAWVKIPVLSSDTDTELCIKYGGNAWKNPGRVFDRDYKVVKHLNSKQDPDIQLPDGTQELADKLTVQAWVYGERTGGEALQPLVSKWAPSTAMSRENFSAYNAGNTDGLETKGYFGAVFDGRYVYFSPQRNGQEKDSVHGYVLRYDTQKDFYDESSWEAYDASNTDGLETRGHYGAVYEGRYVYFVPRGRNYGSGPLSEGHTRMHRYDTHKNFKDKAAWEAFDLEIPMSHQSAGYDGRYIYICPGYEYGDDKKSLVESSLVIRFDTKGGLKDMASYTTFDVEKISPLAYGNYDGAAFDGRYMYFIPLGSGVPVQYDTTQDFQDVESWKMYDAKPLGMKQNVGASFDGRYLYYDSYGVANIIRFDTEGDFADGMSWKAFDASQVPGNNGGGFDGGFYDSRYVWFAPFTGRGTGDRSYIIQSNFLRYDTQQSFDDPASWDSFDASVTDGLLTGGYNAGAFDGRFFYLAPWRYPEGDYRKVSGNVLRVDTLAGGTGSFSLRYCDYGHNGGLNAALPGPSFLVNTVDGPVSIYANEALEPGWHHLSGVYDGTSIKLYIDGKLANERTGSGAIQNNRVDIEIGRIKKGNSRFRGKIDEVRVSTVARSDNWIKTEFNNLSNPKIFIRVGEEEKIE